jgi:hypothetical protein
MRTLRRLWVLAALGLGLVLPLLTSAPISHAAGNSDAAHMCQNGGYLTLEGSDGTAFKNAGQCTSFAASGGIIVGIPACSVVPGTSGCQTLTNVSASYFFDPSLGTITVSGVYSFAPTASNCNPCSGAASGGGTYTLSAGSTFNGGAASGTFSVTGTASANYATDASFTTEMTCPLAGVVGVSVNVIFTSATGTTSAILHVTEGSVGTPFVQIQSAIGTFPLFLHAFPSGVTYSC